MYEERSPRKYLSSTKVPMTSIFPRSKRQHAHIGDNDSYTPTPAKKPFPDAVEESETLSLWEHFAVMSQRDKQSILLTVITYLNSYLEFQKDPSYQIIMNDVISNEKYMAFKPALINAIRKHRDLILQSVEKCRRNCTHDPHSTNIWCILADQSINQDCCWFSGSECFCNDCKGASIFRSFYHFATIFHIMETKDELIHKILKDAQSENSRDLLDGIISAVEKNEEAIQRKMDEAIQSLNRCVWGEEEDLDFSPTSKHGSGMRLNPYAHQM